MPDRLARLPTASTPVPLFRDPRHHLGLSPTFVGSRTTCLPPFDTAFRVYLIFWYLSLLDNGTLAPLPPMLSPLSQSHQLALGLIRTGALPIANLPILSGPESLSPESPVAVVGTYQFPQNRDWLGPTESSSARPLCCDDIDVFDALDVALLPMFATVPARRVSFPRILFARSHRLPRFHQLAISDILLFVVRFFHLVVSQLLTSRAIFVAALVVSLTSPVARLCPYVTLRRSLESRVYFFSLLCSCFAFLDFPEKFFPLVFVIFLFSPHFPNRGRSVFKAPRRGNQSFCSTSQVPGPTTRLSSPSHKATSSTPRDRSRTVSTIRALDCNERSRK